MPPCPPHITRFLPSPRASHRKPPPPLDPHPSARRREALLRRTDLRLHLHPSTPRTPPSPPTDSCLGPWHGRSLDSTPRCPSSLLGPGSSPPHDHTPSAGALTTRSFKEDFSDSWRPNDPVFQQNTFLRRVNSDTKLDEPKQPEHSIPDSIHENMLVGTPLSISLRSLSLLGHSTNTHGFKGSNFTRNVPKIEIKCYRPSEEFTEHLLGNEYEDSQVNASAQNAPGYSASIHGFMEVAEIETECRRPFKGFMEHLLGNKCEASRVNKPAEKVSVSTVWEEAIALGDKQNIIELLNHGLNPNLETTPLKVPPLILAVKSGNEGVVKLLLAAGAEINSVDEKQLTALHYAASAGQWNLVKLLVVAGANIYAMSEEGLLPFELSSDKRTRHLLTLQMRSDMESCVPHLNLNVSDSTVLEDIEGGSMDVNITTTSKTNENVDEQLQEAHDTENSSDFQRDEYLECSKVVTINEDQGLLENQSVEKSKEKKVKFVFPSEDDLVLIRKDWHDAARAGCTGCGQKGCDGQCLPQSINYQERTDNRENLSLLAIKQSSFESEGKQAGTFHWKKGDLIGEGAYGKVFAGLNQSTGELIAVKQLTINYPVDDQEKTLYLTSLEREISFYRKLRHKHIVGYIGMEIDEASGNLFIFLEYVSGGSIQSMLERFGPFSEELVRVYTRQLLLGLEYLHQNKIVHRDIKGGNVLVDSSGVVKLSDFGASKAFHDPTITDGCKSIRGSIFWMAPEVIKGDGYGRRADIWSLGCTVIEMFTAMHPWPAIENTWAAIFHIAKDTSGPPIPENVSECARDFLKECFKIDPKFRPISSELLQHPFVAAMESTSMSSLYDSNRK